MSPHTKRDLLVLWLHVVGGLIIGLVLRWLGY